MSLIVHFPLNGDFHSQGLGIVPTLSYNGANWSDGKLGSKSLYIKDKAASNIFNVPELAGAAKFSIGVWWRLNQNDMDTAGNYADFFGIQINVDGIESWYRIEHSNNTSQPGRVQSLFPRNSTYFNPAYAGYVYTGVLYDWNHEMVTVDDNNIKWYINGELKYTVPISTIVKNHIHLTGHIVLGGPDKGARVQLQDFRIYDTCLSEEEIRQISQGLITHYPLSDPYGEYYTNLYAGEQAFGGADTASNFTKTKKMEDGEIYYNYSGSHSASSTGNQWYYLNFKTYTFTPGKSYFISFKMRTNSCTNMSLTFRHSRVYNDYKGCKSKVVVSSSTSSKWTEYYLIQVIPESFVYDGTVNTCAPLLEFYTNNLASLDCSMDFDLKDVMVVESDHYLPFVSRSTNGIVYDISGYGNHGNTVVDATPVWNSDSPFYSGSYFWKDNADYIAVKPCFSLGQKIPELTLSCWFKTNTLNGTAPNIIALGQNSFIRYRIANASAIWAYMKIGSVMKGIEISCKNLLDNIWHLSTIVFKQGIYLLYIDGIQVSSQNFTDTGTYLTCSNTDTWIIGGYSTSSEKFIGQLSDFRIYASALPSDDILSLYQRRFAVSTEADLYCSEFIENDGITNLSRVGILSAQNIVEMDGMDYVKQLSTLSYTPTKSTNSCISAYRFYQADAGVIAGDTVTIELDVEWSGFDASNTDGTFNIRFQGERYKPDGSYEWSLNPYTTALNNKYYLKTLVLSSESGHYHYVATTEAFTSDLADFSSMTIGLRSDYSNGIGKITLSNCKAYKTQYYLGDEKTRITSNEVIANDFIEF